VTLRKQPDQRGEWSALLILFLILVALGMLLAFCAVEPRHAYAQSAPEPVVVRVGNFGKPMEPIAPSYTNDPERITLSENFYSNQPGARQTRYGFSNLFSYVSLKTQSADAITVIESEDDSSAIVFMAGGKWWWSFFGVRAAGISQFVSSVATPREIRPYSPGTVTISAGTNSVAGVGTSFTRFLQKGDTLYVDDPTDTFVVLTVVSDAYLLVDTLNGFGAHSGDSWQASRVYTGTDPFLHASGEFIYTGSVKDKPQVIFNKDDTVFIRPLVMVDSFYVDAITTKYTDTATGGGQMRKSWVAASTDTVVEEVQLISRRADWNRDQWLTTPEGSPVSYFIRLGWWNTDNDQWGRFYTIRGNSETSMYIATWYRDSLVTGVRDSVQLEQVDSMATGDVATTPWAYIYTAVGSYDVVVADTATGTANLHGRGAVWRTIDAAPYLIDTAEFYNSLHFIHLTKDDISFPAYTAGVTTVNTYVIKRRISTLCPLRYSVEEKLTPDQLPDGDTIVSYKEGPNDQRETRPECKNWYGYWTIKSTNPKRPVQALFVNDAFYPIRNARRFGDTLWLVTSAVSFDMAADTSVRSTANWEIVKVGMPSWDGITSWGNPPQLVAWGDTNSLSVLSFAGVLDPWNWTTNSDVSIGENPSERVVGVLGFDDQLLAFKRSSIIGWDGSRFTDITQGHGLIARDALVADNKQAYWLDIDGPYTIARRDFSGYTIQKIGAALDPVFNAWSPSYFGTSVVPFYMNPAKRSQAVMRKNKFDDHLYLFFASDSSATNNRCLTFSLGRNEWDGYFTLGASAAMPFVWKDTTCLVYADNDTAIVKRTTLTWNDAGTGITSTLKSGRFWITDQSGWPVEGTLERVRFAGRGSDILLDSLQLVVSVNSSMSGGTTSAASDSATLDMATSISDGQFTWYPSSDLTGTYWDWRISVKGRTGGALFAPYEMLFEFSPQAREK
jgi:hypothetical protein